MPKLRFDPRTLNIILDVYIKADFEETARFVLDTGASLVVIPWRLAIAIGLKIDPKKTIQTTTASMVETVPEVIIPEMSVLGQRVKNVKAMVKDLPSQAPVDGLLGLSFLKYFNLNINFKKGELSLE